MIGNHRVSISTNVTDKDDDALQEEAAETETDSAEPIPAKDNELAFENPDLTVSVEAGANEFSWNVVAKSIARPSGQVIQHPIAQTMPPGLMPTLAFFLRGISLTAHHDRRGVQQRPVKIVNSERHAWRSRDRSETMPQQRAGRHGLRDLCRIPDA